jgi:hypothetical protein
MSILKRVAWAVVLVLGSFLNVARSDEDAVLDLFRHIDLKSQVISGNWRFSSGILESAPGNVALLQLPYSPPAEYDLDVTILRGNPPQIGLPVAGVQVPIAFGWPQPDGRLLNGIGYLDGKKTILPEAGIEGAIIPQTGPYTVHCEVRNDRIIVRVGKKEVVDWRGDRSRLSHSTLYDTPNKAALYFGVWDSQIVISSVKVTPLEAGGQILAIPSDPPDSLLAKLSSKDFRKRLKCRSLYDEEKGQLTLFYDFLNTHQFEDYLNELDHNPIQRGAVMLQGGESITHRVKFKTLTVAGTIHFTNVGGNCISTTGDYGFGTTGMNGTLCSMYCFAGRDRSHTNIDYKKMTDKPFAFQLVISESRIGSQVGPIQLGTAITANPAVSAGQLILRGAGGPCAISNLTLIGKIDPEWARTFFPELATDSDVPAASGEPQVLYKDASSRSVVLSSQHLAATEGTLVFQAHNFAPADGAELDKHWNTLVPHVFNELEKNVPQYAGRIVEEQTHSERFDGSTITRTVHFVVRLPVERRFEGTKFDANHRAFNLQGWKVYVQKELLMPDSSRGEIAVAILDRKLKAASSLYSTKQLRLLQQVPFWINDHDPSDKKVTFLYRPSFRNQNPKAASPQGLTHGVEIIGMDAFTSPEMDNDGCSIVIHELAHAYHHQVLGFGNAQIKSAFQNAVRSGKYNQVKNGAGEIVKSYALTNEMEYFAECSEAYFARNDSFPFVREELREFDPEGYQVMMLWGDK